MPDVNSISQKIFATAEVCIECGKCVQECHFLSENGSPLKIAQTALQSQDDLDSTALKSYDCSMCKLCSAVCPVDAQPAEMFTMLRYHARQRRLLDFKKYSALTAYERTGGSFPFKDSLIPDNARSAFFPGCTLPGLFPKATLNTFAALRRHDPAYGLILNCCSKPSKMLGLQKEHKASLAPLIQELQDRGIEQVVTGCPNCYLTLKEAGPSFKVRSVYEELRDINFVPVKPHLTRTTIHDPCVTRFESDIHDSIRELLQRAGIAIDEMNHCRERTLCCGEGGAVPFNRPEYSEGWSAMRITEAKHTSLPMTTYCAGCVNMLSPKHTTTHILDLLTVERKCNPGPIPFVLSYLNRLALRLLIRFK